VAFEVVLVPMWAVIRWWGDPHDEAGRRDAAARFVLYTALGSAVMLAGLLVVALESGSTDIVALTNAQGQGIDRVPQVVAAALLVAGLAVKVPVWPLHTWLAPAHTAAPTVGSVLLAGVLLKMGTYGLVRVAVPLVPQGFEAVAPYLRGGRGGRHPLGRPGVPGRARPQAAGRLLVGGAHGLRRLGIASGTPQGLQGALFANIAHGVITGLLFVVAGGLQGPLPQRPARRHRRRAARTVRRAFGALLAAGCVAGLGLPGLGRLLGRAARRLRRVAGAHRRVHASGLEGPRSTRRARHRTRRRLPAGGCCEPSGTARAPPRAPPAPTRGRSGATPSMRAAAPQAAAHTPATPPVPSWPSLCRSFVVTVVLGLVPWVLLHVTEPAVRHLLALGRGEV
jgi:NADH-quinone oxidoreductase subunit M